jgi:hypothetical protein
MKPTTGWWWLRRWSGGLLISVLVWAPAAGAEAVPGTRVLISGQTGLMVRNALLEAKQRLEHPACAELLAEFHGSDGLPLTAHILLTPTEYLSSLWFVDGDDDRRCRIWGAPIAFTAPGHPVIYVCSSHFARKYLQNQFYAEVILIHEMLHAAGLGENPPTSDQISRAAKARCASI